MWGVNWGPIRVTMSHMYCMHAKFTKLTKFDACILIRGMEIYKRRRDGGGMSSRQRQANLHTSETIKIYCKVYRNMNKEDT